MVMMRCGDGGVVWCGGMVMVLWCGDDCVVVW